MKYVIIGDLHGADLWPLEQALNVIGPDCLICTGDFDRAHTIRQFKNLENKYLNKGKSVFKVPGNHDHAILNNMNIQSGTLMEQCKTSQELHIELIRDRDARKYLDELVNSKNPEYVNSRIKTSLDEERFGKNYPTIIMHGAYAGNLLYFPNCPQNMQDFWTRLITNADHEKNFRVMKIRGYNVMIRGHDHDPSYVYNDLKKGVCVHSPKADGFVYRLFENRQHTINPGALAEGFLAIIDTQVKGEKVPTLQYFKI